ncbi:MAG: PD-(D/E)XK nuclease family protein, partial [Bacteroidales bacterium]|nr:PD-(D/E)XK nuclease family protein [Bacteroidales bacterium]
EMTYVGEKISDKWFQVMYYAWLYWREHKPARMEAGIYPLQNFGTFFLPAKIQYDKNTLDTSFSAKHFELFEKYVKDLLSTIFNKDIPFEQNKKKCKFCPFTNICEVEEKTF